MSVTLEAAPSSALVDETVRLRATGLDPGERVTVVAEFATGEARWRGGAQFDADEDGVVDLTDHAPVAGDYEGVRPMGLVQFARPWADEEAPPPDRHDLQVRVGVDGEVVAETTVERRALDPGVETVRVEDEHDDLVGDLLLPPGDGPHPGVVVFGGSGGGVPNDVRAKLLASRGYAVLALAYFQPSQFGREFGDDHDFSGLPERLAGVPVEYLVRGVEWVRGRDDVREEPVGVLGSSRGSEAAFLVAERVDAVEAVVAYAPGAYAFPAPDDPDDPSWTADGEPLAHVRMQSLGAMARWLPGFLLAAVLRRPVSFTPLFAAAVDRDGDREAAALPTSGLDASVLLVAGEDDRLWPSARFARAIADRLADGNCECLCYDGAGHSLTAPYLPARGREAGEAPVIAGLPLRLGGSPTGYGSADADAWPRVLDTLARALRE